MSSLLHKRKKTRRRIYVMKKKKKKKIGRKRNGFRFQVPVLGTV
jgi:hypothetical protein